MSVNPLQPRIQGLTYPLTLSNGGLAVSADLDLVSQHVLSVVETRWYERVMRASYGTDDFIFQVIKPSVINSQFQQAIEQDVPELSAVTVVGDWTGSDSGLYRVIITYYINGVPQPQLSFTLSI
jgi:phage baseplate assembly protein W